MSLLPTEILLKIWSYLITNKDMWSIRCTCKRFKNLCDRYGYIRSMTLDNFYTKNEYMKYLEHQNALYVLEIQNIPRDEYKLWFSENNIPVVKYRWGGVTRLIRCNA